MDIIYEEKYHQLEEKHWWFSARRDMVLRLVESLELGKQKAILEIGCSGGPLLKKLRGKGYTNVYGIDISESAIDLAKRRGLENVTVMDGAKLNFLSESFDLVIASDVLEHIQDEEKAIIEWERVLKPGGKLIVFVPAFNSLWSQHDIINHHFRRYTDQELINLVKKNKLTVLRSSYWNGMLFFPTYIIRKMQNFLQKKRIVEKKYDNLLKIDPLLNFLLKKLVVIENIIISHFKLPVGVSVFITATKSEESV